MKRTLLAIITILITSPSFAQLNLDWAKATDGGYSCYASAKAVDNQGNIIITGRFTGTYDFDPGSNVANLSSAGSSNRSDAFLAKYDSLGNYKWAIRIGEGDIDQGVDVIVDDYGSVYMCGHFHDSADFDPSTSVAKLYASRSYEKFIAKYDSSGSYQWAVNFGSTWAYSIEFDHDGNILAGGKQSSGNDYDPGPGTVLATSNAGYIIKFDPNGNFLSVMEFSSSLGFVNDIETDINGNMLFTGYINGTVDFDPGPGTQNLTPYGTLDVIVAKYDSLGNYQWAFNLGNSAGSHGRGRDITTDNYGNVYVTGDFTSSGSKIDLDPGVDSAYFNRSGTSNGFIAKYTSTGKYCWGQFIGSTSVSTGYGIVSDAVGNVFTTGRMTGTTDFDRGPGTAMVSSFSSSRADIFVSQYTTNGKYIDAFVISNSDGEGTDIEISKDGNVLLCGVFSRSTDFDHGPGTLNLSNSSTYGEIFFLRYNGCSNAPGQPTSVVGPDTICSGSKHTYAVSGTSGATSYSWSLPTGWSGSSSDTNITVVAGSNGGTVSVSANNGCGSSASQSKNVVVNFVDTSVTQSSNLLTSNNGNSGVTYQWLDCNNNYAPISGATGQSYTATANGSYAVQLTENGCVDTSLCYNVTGVGILQSFNERIEVSPNPNNGQFIVSLYSNQPATLTIYDVVGNEVLRTEGISSKNYIDLSDQSEGVYILLVETGLKTYTEKIVLQ